jgi:hypothetical protein
MSVPKYGVEINTDEAIKSFEEFLNFQEAKDKFKWAEFMEGWLAEHDLEILGYRSDVE